MPPAEWSEWRILFWSEPCIYKHGTGKMNNIIGNNGEEKFANGQSSRDLRARLGNLHERTDSSYPLEALRSDSDEVLERQIELPDGPGRKSGRSGGTPWYRRITRRVV